MHALTKIYFLKKKGKNIIQTFMLAVIVALMYTMPKTNTCMQTLMK